MLTWNGNHMIWCIVAGLFDYLSQKRVCQKKLVELFAKLLRPQGARYRY